MPLHITFFAGKSNFDWLKLEKICPEICASNFQGVSQFPREMEKSFPCSKNCEFPKMSMFS